MYAKFLFLIAFFIHGMVFLIGNWKMSWKIIIQYSKVDENLLKTKDVNACEEIHVLEHARDGSIKQDIVKKEIDAQLGIVFFNYHKKKYILDADKKVFRRVKPQTEFPISHF